MDAHTLVLPLFFILLSSVVGYAVIQTKWRWWAKLLIVTVIPSLGILAWKAQSSLLGWPTPEALPDKALLLWGESREPDKATGDKGAIFLWLRTLKVVEKDGLAFLDYESPKGEPRAYKLPYSREAHKGLERAMQMRRAGKQVVVGRGMSGQGQGEGESGEGRPGNGRPGRSGRPGNRGPQVSENEQEIHFYRLPPPTMPPKEAPPEMSVPSEDESH